MKKVTKMGTNFTPQGLNFQKHPSYIRRFSLNLEWVMVFYIKKLHGVRKKYQNLFYSKKGCISKKDHTRPFIFYKNCEN